jgi:hypothetical protein
MLFLSLSLQIQSSVFRENPSAKKTILLDLLYVFMGKLSGAVV